MSIFARTAFAASVVTLAGIVGASATPSMSRGEQKIPIRYQECMNRAVAAFQTNGWVNIGQGGAVVQGFRGAEGAYITCNEVGDITVINVFVASDNQDANVPGTARQQLQAAMSNPGAVQNPQGPVVQGAQQQWHMVCCNGAYSGTMSITTQQQGDTVNFSGTLSSDFNGGNVFGSWSNSTGQVSFRREIGSPNNVQNYRGTIVNQGGRVSMSGTWDGAYSGSAPPDWRADLLSAQ